MNSVEVWRQLSLVQTQGKLIGQYKMQTADCWPGTKGKPGARSIRRKFRFKGRNVKWNRKFPETHFENFALPPEVVLFSGNLEILEIFCSIWYFYSEWVGPNFSSRTWKLQDAYGGESILHWMQNDLLQFELFIDRLSLTNTLGSAFLKNCGLVVLNSLWVFARFA